LPQPGSDPSAVIPAQPQTSTDPGPPFSFWGRGAPADWTLFIDQFSAGALDLTGLSKVRLSIGCIGFVVQGGDTASGSGRADCHRSAGQRTARCCP
jgi:hypothetical protein